MSSTVFIKKYTSDPSVDELKMTIHKILDDSGLIFENKKVLVKPNMLGAFDPSVGATTDPRIVEAVVLALMERNAVVYVGDSPGGVEKGAVGTAKKCGIYDASCGHFVNMNEKVSMIQIKSRFFKEINVATIVKEVDLVINLPKLKTHGYMGITGCIKNMFGIIVGPGKAKLHFVAPTVKQFGEMLVDIYQIRIPDLNIVDALYVMEGTGPTSGPLKKINTIIAGIDGLAVDTVLTKMAGFINEEIQYIVTATKRGLGESDFNKIKIDGEFFTIQNFERPITYKISEDNSNQNGKQGMNTKGLTYLFQMGNMKPKITKSESCTKCQLCVKSCPALAITLQEIPVIDYKKCISCFCCSELCPQDCYEILDNSEMFSNIFTSFEEGINS